MPQRDPIDFEIELEDAGKPMAQDAQAAKPKRRPIVPPLSVREPFWWAVASMILMLVAFAFVLFVARA